ncbi:MAG: MurR/RpiR family transcriptional regulator [Candidatus Pacebacteria bacterium]|nr:MurR/RpiR family transcriptional regulator [Candidatus Paceibacterota bacterium]
MNSCLKQISSIHNKLSYSEKIFADYILEHRETVIYMSVAELSEILKIAPSTIVAATKKLGFSGWREFKVTLATEMVSPFNVWVQDKTKIDETDMFRYVVTSNIQMLQEMTENIESTILENVAEILYSAEKLSIFGVGTSNILAHEAFDSFFRLGLPCTIYDDWHHQLLAVSKLKADTVALFISQSGVNRDIITLAELAKQTDCKTIGICNFSGTPFGKYMDLLISPLKETSQIHDNHFSLRIPILCIIESIFYIISKKMGDQFTKEIEKSYQVVKRFSV